MNFMDALHNLISGQPVFGHPAQPQAPAAPAEAGVPANNAMQDDGSKLVNNIYSGAVPQMGGVPVQQPAQAPPLPSPEPIPGSGGGGQGHQSMFKQLLMAFGG